MSAPSGKPSPEGTRVSGTDQAMAIEDADNDGTVSDISIHASSQAPSERSRSDKREVRVPHPPGAIVPQVSALRFTHRGPDHHASREGMPAGSRHVHANTVEVHHHETNEMNNTLNLQQVQQNEVHVNMHDPAITQMVEQVAEARHRETMINTEHMMQSMMSEMSGRLQAEEQAASARMSHLMTLAESREHQFREEFTQQGEMYKRVLDGNARQSNATKDQQLKSLKDHYERQDEHRKMQLSQMESIIKQQSEQIKAQQLQTESMNMTMSKLLDAMGPMPTPIVETTTAVIPPTTEVKITAPLAAFSSASASKPLNDDNGAWEMLNDDGNAPADVFDPMTEYTGLRSPTFPPTSVAPSDTGNPPNGPNPPDGDDDGSNGGNGNREGRDKRGKKHPSGSRRPPGGGPGDGDDDDGDDDGDNSDDSDKKFIRRMRQMFGNPKDQSNDKNRVKEADSVKLPAFPNPESYRNWRIRTREAVMSASTDPDKAFDWVSETWKEGQTIEYLRNVGKFTTLDAKLLSALTNILTGDFARKVDTYKETEATNHRYVRGRQVLFMMHEYFSTNIKHGATYSLQDLFSVKMKGENLRGFISNWDQVMAGIPKVPETSILETLFFNQVKNSKAIAHDLQEYHRAEEGSDKKTYNFLVTAVRRYLDRERLESNRERVARTLGATSSSAAPAVGEKTGYIPKGYCVKWNKGSCTNDSCTYKHEKPPPKKDRSQSRPPSERGRSPSRGRNDKGKKKQPCKFWKQGRCNRGTDCRFSHEGKQSKSPRAATPARPSSNDSRGSRRKNSRSPGKGRDRSPKQKGSRSPRNSRSPKGNKGKPDTPKASPAAVCLIASMLASVSNACLLPPIDVISCPAVTFDTSHDVYHVIAKGDLVPVNPASRKYRRTYPMGYPFEFDEQDREDACLSASMLAGAVKNSLMNKDCKCNYECDTMFGCDHCIPKEIVAMPAKSEEYVDGCFEASIDWIVDTGSAQDLLTDHHVPDHYGYYSDNPIRLITANGESSSMKQGKVKVPELNATVSPYLVQSSPPVLSVGLRCVEDGFDFIWRGSKNEEPKLVSPDGKVIELEVRDYVPYLCSKSNQSSVSAVAKNHESQMKRVKVLASSSGVDHDDDVDVPPTPDLYDEDYEDDEPAIVGGSSSKMDDDLVPDISGDPGADAPSDEEGIPSADREVQPDVHEEVVHRDPEMERRRERGKTALKAEAKSKRHMLTHIPKNPYCDVCTKAKMYKPPGYSKGGSSMVEAKKFGDHVTGDYLIAKSDPETGVDGDRVAMVFKDVATDFRYVYPVARRDTANTTLAMKHFVDDVDKIGIFYSDNAPEIVAAMRALKIRHQISKDYISTSNAIAERAVRSTLEGTRANLLQAGLHHGYWPYAARHWCMMHDAAPDGTGNDTPWKLRFGTDFTGPLIPFGCKVDYWSGPRKKPKRQMKFEPTTEPGIFLGYVIHPGFHWRKEFAVVSLKQFNEADFDQAITVLRVLKLSIPDKIEFPCRKRADAIREGRIRPNQLCDEEDALPPLEDQDAQPVREPGPAKRTVAEIEAGQPVQQSSASAVYHQGWLEFFKHVDHKEAWYEYAECKINIRILETQCIGPSSDFSASDFPFRTTCVKNDESWHVYEENLKIDPPIENLDKDMLEIHEVIATIFSKEPIDLRNRIDMPEAGDEPEGEVDVINPMTGEMEKIKKSDPSYYDAGGFKARKYKNSSKPKDIPPFVWQAMSQKERRSAIAEEQRKLALEEKERKRAKRVKAVPMIGTLKMTPNELEENLECEFIPAMPVCQMNPQKHRVKCVRLGIQSGEKAINTLVARPVGKKEIRANPKAQQALDVEWEKLVKKNAWQYETVSEWKVIADKAKKSGKKVHVGKVFEICVEKGSELPEGDKLRKFKGRTVFQGNNVKDESSDVALFSELGSSPATMEAGKAVDAYGAQPGFITQQNDGVQAYTQALWKGIETWVELPIDRWPKEWHGKFIRPVVLLRIALYGHPDSGGLWEQFCEAMLKLVGFVMPDPEGWPSVFFHPELKLLLVVYVDDFKMSGPKENMSKGWSLIASKIDMDTPGEVNRYLGCDHVVQHNVKLMVGDHPYAHVFDKSLADPAAPAAAACHRTQDFWELDTVNEVYMRHHVQPRKKLFLPDEEVIKTCQLAPFRFTNAIPCHDTNKDHEVEQWDTIGIGSNTTQGSSLNETWIGTTYFFPTSCKDPKAAMATIKRDKSGAKKKARAEGFSYMDQLFESQPCMQKPVTTFTYDMEPFLKSCVDRYVTLAGRDAKPLKHVSTPLHEERIARPVADEKETKGVLAPIAARVLMKVLFAARMARFDLLRAVQGLAARVTKWSADCDKALHRLICYINSTLDYKQRAFIGDRVDECRLWLFADADHAGEYDNRSTSGCILVLVGPNTYFPLTAFSKKQTAVAMSSTESEVVSANVSLRAVGLPSSGLWAYLQNAGGEKKHKDSIPGGLPRHDIETQKESNGEYWQFMRSRRLLVRVHTKPRSHLFNPVDMSKSPINIKRIGCSRTTVMLKDGMVDFMQDNWKVKMDYPINGEWIGKTFFRVYGPYESDYNIESMEIREALTDYEFVGREEEGECMISMFSPRSIKGVFVEDNQATIRILENGKSPTFRHTDKTQRVNLSWLEEQFKRRWYKLVHGPSMLQAADILTKPFVNAEKWKLAVKLLAITPVKKNSPQKASAPALEAPTPLLHAAPCTGGPAAKSDAKRLIVEVCCHPESKLSQTNRKWSEGCEILQFTKEFDLHEVENQMRIAEHVNSFKGDVKPLIWISLPCTGGTPWTYINMKNPSAREKVLKQIREFDRLWISLKSFLRMLSCDVHIALEWPRKCRYWKLTKVANLLNQYEMLTYNFDGCALGMKNQEGEPLKKPWTVATNHAGIGKTLSKFQCKCERRHAPGRGIALKRTEEYTFRMTDAIHKALIWQHTPLKTACCALSATFRFVVDAMLARAIQMAKACAVAGRPAILERITLWEGVVNTLKGAIAVITWDEPQVLLREMEGCRLPIANIVEPTLSGGNAEGAYDVLAEVFRNTPDGYLAMCPYPPGGEVDLLIVSDSSLALVPDPNAGKTSCFSGGDLLKPWGDVRGIYTKMLWGKGLNNMVQYIPEALDDIESTNRVHGRPVLPVLVIVGWAGNDVFGEGGYRGVHWIHRAAYNKSAADREVTANWCERQRARVNKSVEDLGELKRTEPRIADIVVVGNADADLFALPTSYNETMRVHVRALREDHSIQTVDTTLMLARTTRYDKVHLLDDAINRKYMANFLQAVAECHLAFMKLVSVDDHLRTLPRIESVEEQRDYPNLPALRVAYQMEIESNVASPQDLPARPDMEKVMLEADLEILNWVLQAEESATATADREVEPWMREIAEEDQAIEPMHLDNADSDDEIIKVQALTTEDRLEARRKGFSEEPDQEWQDATYGGDDEKEEFKGWDLVEESKRPPGVVASDPVNEAEDELDIDDLVTEASLEIVEEEEFHDVDEGQAEGIDDDDDDDMAVISKVSSMQSAGKDAQGDLEPMDVDEKGDKMAQSSSSVKTWKTDISSVASAGATPSDPTSKLKPKAKPAKKAMPKRLKVVDEGHGPSAEQFDTSKFTTAQDLVWIEPDNMVGVPVRKVDYGRLSSISHAMSDYLRGHRMFHRRPSPEIRRTDLSMDFKALVRHLQGDFAHLREEEVLMVVRNSPMRRFRIQVNGLSSGKLKWTPIRIRAIQGHRAFLVQEGGMASMIKVMYTFDQEFDQNKVDDPQVHPAFCAMPEGSPVWDQFPRVIYHTCDQAAFTSIVQHGLIPGGFPYKTGRAHNFFNSTPPWKAEMKKLQGTRAGRPIAIAFDTEMLMQQGIKLFATDEAILSPDWVTNLAIMNAYDMRSGEFFFINRAYVNHRKMYQEVLKEAKQNFDPDDTLVSRMEMNGDDAIRLFDKIKDRVEFGKLLAYSAHDPLTVEKSTATREGEAASGSQLVEATPLPKW